MTSFTRIIEIDQSKGAEAVFEALCRVHERAANESPQQVLGRLSRELADPPPADADDDELPDFSEPLDFGDSSAPEPRLGGLGGEGPDPQRVLMQGLARTLGSYRALLERYRQDFDEAFARRAAGAPEPEDETLQRLREAQAVLVKYPLAAQAAFAALVREGRRYATTEAGQAWKQRLASSEVLARARTLFEGLANGLVAEGAGPLPSAYVDGFLRALDRGLEDVLTELGGTRREP